MSGIEYLSFSDWLIFSIMSSSFIHVVAGVRISQFIVIHTVLPSKNLKYWSLGFFLINRKSTDYKMY